MTELNGLIRSVDGPNKVYEWLNNNGGTYHTHTAKLIQIEEIKRD